MRSGNYIKQPSGYKAFIPNPLPPNPSIKFDQELQQLLSNADRALGRLDGAVHILPNPDLFIFMYVRKEAVLSSQIEGTQSSLNHLLEAEAKIKDIGRPDDVDEVINYVWAMNHGIKRLEELPLSVRLIKEIHSRLLKDVRGNKLSPGEIRTTQNWIGPEGCNLNNAIFVPPPQNEVMNQLSEFEKFLHKKDNMPILIKIGLAHAQFETIHPFLDGNGRVGRLLITFLLCQQNILSKPVLYLSYFFRQHRDQYYELLQQTRDNGDWESWIKFFLQGIADVSREATRTCRQIVDMRELHRNLITNGMSRTASNGLQVLEYLYEKPIISVKDIVDLVNITYPSANSLMGKLEELEIVSEITGQTRNRIYRYNDYINLFR